MFGEATAACEATVLRRRQEAVVVKRCQLGDGSEETETREFSRVIYVKLMRSRVQIARRKSQILPIKVPPLPLVVPPHYFLQKLAPVNIGLPHIYIRFTCG